MKRISSAHPLFFPCQQIQPTENCTRSLEKCTGQFLKSVRSINISKELQKLTFLLTSITFQDGEAGIREQAASEAFIVPCRKPHLATRVFLQPQQLAAFCQQLNLIALQNTEPHTQTHTHTQKVIAKLCARESRNRREKTTHECSLEVFSPVLATSLTVATDKHFETILKLSPSSEEL